MIEAGPSPGPVCGGREELLKFEHIMCAGGKLHGMSKRQPGSTCGVQKRHGSASLCSAGPGQGRYGPSSLNLLSALPPACFCLWLKHKRLCKLARSGGEFVEVAVLGGEGFSPWAGGEMVALCALFFTAGFPAHWCSPSLACPGPSGIRQVCCWVEM